MSRLVLLCLLASSLAAPNLRSKRATTALGQFFTNAGKSIGQEAVDVKTIVAMPVVKTVSDVCPSVKDLFGLSYEELKKDEEPDLSSLALMIINSEVIVRLNMTTAAKVLLNSNAYNTNQDIYLYCHGFTDAPTKSSFGNVSAALFSQGYTNVLALDASKLLRWLYLRSSTYVAYIGEQLGRVLADMYQLGVDPSRIHIIGHSLGAHISGFTGKQFYRLTGRHVGRISGLDPAGPCFTKVKEGMKLNKTDAEFVDIIHSDAGVAGLLEPVGHVDFYPNEGMNQPGCLLSDSCSHSRSWQLFSESIIYPKSFPAAHCSDWSAFREKNCSGIGYMGFDATSNLTGNYYLQTSGEAPYSLGSEGTVYHNNQGVVRNISEAAASWTYWLLALWP